MPKSLGPCFTRSYWRVQNTHGDDNADELIVDVRVRQDGISRRYHTIADERNHIISVPGKAIIYRMRLVKLHKRKKLPMNPKARDRPLRMSSLFGQQNIRKY